LVLNQHHIAGRSNAGCRTARGRAKNDKNMVKKFVILSNEPAQNAPLGAISLTSRFKKIYLPKML
jgi:hypothetical protein